MLTRACSSSSSNISINGVEEEQDKDSNSVDQRNACMQEEAGQSRLGSRLADSGVSWMGAAGRAA